MPRKQLVAVSAISALGLTLLGACAGGAEQERTSPAAPQVSRAQQAVGSTELAATQLEGIGEGLTDKAGMTLYRFDKDTAKPPKATCNGDCASQWPPVLSDGDPVLDGVDAAAVGKVRRDDGTEQVTVGGWPVYRFAKDTKAGDAKGQGVGSTWFAVNPKGGKASASAPTSTSAPSVQTRLVASDVEGIGPVLTEQDGFTLYLFDKDTSKPPKATCNGDCASQWPPLLSQGEVQLEGVDTKLVGKVKRADGTDQVTVGGWPVYRYAKDTKPGEAKGHGVGGTWFAIEPNGCKSQARPDEPAPSGY
ncbi:hypothetical protein [Amycolatopsis nigrescens]|uniref:hypothetical protein n=1 Tax=Amycolatopsis nigrescens TaxID=381445 RepID=UPI00036A8F71|nr:hypothetical protein [Amycolatopsis nigrescens]